MEGESSKESELKVSKRKKRGVVKGQIGERKKQKREKGNTSTSGVTSSSCGTSECSETESSINTSALASSDSQTDVDLDSSRCSLPLNDSHFCSESDKFSDTQSDESFSEPEEVVTQKKKRQKKSNLAYKRKETGISKKSLKATDDDSDEDIDVQEFSGSEEVQSLVPDLKEGEKLGRTSTTVPGDPSTSSYPDLSPRFEGVPGDDVKNVGSSTAIPGGPFTSGYADVSFTAESTPIVDAAVLQLINNLKLLLSDHWTIDVVPSNIVRIFNLNKSKNARVEACIFYDFKKAGLGLYVHGFPVPREHKILKSKDFTDADNIGAVSDFLHQLADRVLARKVCSGVNEFQHLWSKFDGYSDKVSSQDEECFRRSDCLLLLEGKSSICCHCQAMLKQLSREAKSKEEAREKQTHIPDKFKTKEELKEQKDLLKHKLRKEKRKSRRLERKLDALQVKLDEVLKDDLTSILRNNVGKMTDIQRLFWESQMQGLAINDRRGLRWHPMLIRLALHLHSLSAAAYEYLQDSSVLVLPSKRRLFDYSHFVETAEGCQEEIISDIKKKILNSGPEDHFSYVNVLFDEMHIRSGLVTKRSTGQLIGYTNLKDVEKDLALLQNEFNNKTYKPKLAKKVLVYMVQGITSTVKDIVAVYSTDDLSAVQLFDRTWDVIYHLEDAGIKVLCLTCDGASTNRKFIRMHQCRDKASKVVYCTNNLASGDNRPLYFIIDPPHLLKTVRNALANSFSHRKSRKLWKNGEFMSWKVLENIYEITKKEKYVGHKLTKAHIKLTSFSCMTVSYATQALSNSVADCIEEFSNHESMDLLDTNELVKFIRMMNRFFDCVNGKQEVPSEQLKNADLAAYTDSNDERLAFLEGSFLDYFEDWKSDILHRPGIFTETEKSQSIISHQALEALQVTVHSIVGCIRFMLDEAKAPFINARIFNQDPLEQYFSIVRRKQGDNRNPTIKSFGDTRLQLHGAGHAALPSQRGNTKAEKRTLQVDSSPLLSRKVKKKH